MQLAPVAQTLPQVLQLLLSLLRSLQAPPQQAGVVPVQVLPQVLQLLGSDRMLVAMPLQSAVHTPLRQAVPAGQQTPLQH